MNIIIRVNNDHELETKFIEEASKKNIVNIGGHKANPGLRISIYNAMPFEGCIVFCKFLDDFRKANPI